MLVSVFYHLWCWLILHVTVMLLLSDFHCDCFYYFYLRLFIVIYRTLDFFIFGKLLIFNTLSDFPNFWEKHNLTQESSISGRWFDLLKWEQFLHLFVNVLNFNNEVLICRWINIYIYSPFIQRNIIVNKYIYKYTHLAIHKVIILFDHIYIWSILIYPQYCTTKS